MELVIRELEGAVVFSEKDIINIKAFLKREEQQDSNYEMALMMAQIVNKRVNQALEGIDRKYWWHFKSAFLKFLATDDKTQISKADIFTVLLTLESEIEKAVDLAYKWLMLQTRDLINSRQLERWLKAIKSGDSTAISAWKRMMMAATTLAVAGSVNFTALPSGNEQFQTTYKIEALEQVKSQKLSRTTELAALCQVASPPIQAVVPVITTATEIKTAPKESKITPKANIATSKNEHLKMGKRVAVYPTRPVKKGIGEKFVIPEVMALKPYDVNQLKAALNERNSLLADEPYFSEIVKTAEAYGVDPRFVFAITAQEQGCVKRSNKNALKIANNPYNVYGSWVNYNTNIGDSSAIVCRTILKRMNKWSGIGDPVVWLNKTYAGDQNWNKGVKANYEKFKNASDIQ